MEVLRKLEFTLGKVPVIIEENIKYIFYNIENGSFRCVLCEISIKKQDKEMTKLNLETHLTSKVHSTNTVSVGEIKEALNGTFLENIPQIVLNNVHVLGMDDMNYHCTMCEKIIPQSENLVIMEENFSYHLLSWGHLENLVNYRLTLLQLKDVYGGISDLILNNTKCIDVIGDSFFCVICKKDLLIDTADTERAEIEFETHFATIKHILNVKQERVFTLIPEFKQVYTRLPNHILRNVEYLSFNGNQFFCSLCNQNVHYIQHDPYLTEQNLKLHIFSGNHEQSLSNRRDPKNQVYMKLKELFEVFSETVMNNLKHLTVLGELVICSLCDEIVMLTLDDEKVDKKKIEHHFDSGCHQNNFALKHENSSTLTKELEETFGCVPLVIQENIEHIEYNGSGFCCNLCNKKITPDLQNCIKDPSSTFVLFEKHLKSTTHKSELENLEAVSKSLQRDVEYLFQHIPPLIAKNWNYIGYDEEDCHFQCFLCYQTIAVPKGSKRKQLTLQNFRTHLLSSHHLKELKKKAKSEEVTTEQLKLIFGNVPELISSNMEHLVKDGGKFCCTICNYHIVSATSKAIMERYFNNHLKSSNHKKELRLVEKLKDQALHELDCKLGFWRIPEFLLRSLDFMSLIGDFLFCTLCQEILIVDENDLQYAKETLRVHFDSKQHQCNLESLMK